MGPSYNLFIWPCVRPWIFCETQWPRHPLFMGEGFYITLFSPSDVTAFYRMKYGEGVLYNLVFTEWRHCVSHNSALFSETQLRPRKRFLMGSRGKPRYIRPLPPYFIVLASSMTTMEAKAIELHRIWDIEWRVYELVLYIVIDSNIREKISIST